MPWNNGPITLYHGTDDISAAAIAVPTLPLNHGISLAHCAPLSDFGQGFYTTTNLNQARNWANVKYLRAMTNPKPPANASVLRFKVDRNHLAALQSLTFVSEDTGGDFWDIITHCRNGPTSHLLWGCAYYDCVFGPVSLWPQNLVIKDLVSRAFYLIFNFPSLCIISVCDAYGLKCVKYCKMELFR